MDPKIILEAIISRLEPEVGEVDWIDFSAWGDDGAAAVIAKLSGGRGHLASALLHAREALESDDQEKIEVASLLCPTLERTGRELEKSCREFEAKTIARNRRKAGGSRRGQQQSAAAKTLWTPWIEEFSKRIQSGEDEKEARVAVVRQMEKTGFSLPGEDAFPADRTIRKWLSTEKVGTQLKLRSTRRSG